MADLDGLLRDFFERSPEGVMFSGADRRIIRANPAFAEMFGYSVDELPGMWTRAFYAEPGDYSEVGARAFSMTTRKRGIIVYIQALRKDGSTFLARCVVIQLTDDAGEATGFVTLVNDVSRMREDATRAAGAIEAHASDAALKALYRRTPAMMYSIGPDGRIVEVSEAWLNRMGYAEDEVVGEFSVNFMDEDSRRRGEAVQAECWTSGRVDRMPFTVIAKDGSAVPVEMSAVIDTSSGERRTLTVVTERSSR